MAMTITDKDVEKLKKHFTTKDDLRRFATKDDLSGEIKSVKSELKTFENKVVTRLDKVMGELEKTREDRIFAKGKDDEQDRRLDGLEGRVEKVESKVG